MIKIRAIVEFQDTRFFNLSSSLELDCGKKIEDVIIAYETYGTLNKKKNNAILIFHALSGSAHVYKNGTKQKGWWDSMIGSKKPFDTDKYFIICSNILGSCYGTTGPSTINKETGKPYGLSFPIITVHDMVKAQKLFIDHLNIRELLSVTGGSLGGMQALDWAISYPEITKTVIPIATTAKTSPQNIAFHEVGRQAIYSDPNWKRGNYYDNGLTPDIGLSIARMVGHITYLSDGSMKRKFGRKFQTNCKILDFNSQFQVESYLHHKGLSFTKRFDANSYIYITKAIDYFDLTNRSGGLSKAFKGIASKFLVLSFTSDWLYPSYQSKKIVSALKANQVEVSFCEIESNYGYDAFLLPSSTGLYEKMVKNFLKTSMEQDN
ncbi:MAG: homoserine O-acetyltransferase MetX [Candidatus Helarchaeota archaeon]